MSDETTDESNVKGKEDVVDTPKPEEPDKVDDTISPLDRAEAANKETAKNLDRKEKLLDREEKLLAEERVGGRARIGAGGTEPESEEKKKINQAQEFFKDTALGDAIKKTNE